jgi:hypothetical protein
MMPFIIGILLLPFLFGGGVLLVGALSPTGGLNTMNTAEERRAVVFEIYRYSICYVMVMVFAVMAFQLLGSALSDMNNIAAMGAPAAGVILSGILFIVHWKMKSPASPAS